MRARVLIGICLAATATGLILFWNLRADSITSSTSASVATPTAGSSERIDVPADALDDSVDSRSDQPAQSTPEDAIESQLARRKQEYADAIYQLGGARIVQGLIDSGLAQRDSETIARRYAADVGECAIAALSAEAARLSISIDDLLTQLATAARDGSDPLEIVDRSSMEAYAFPCEIDALQRAGIPYESVVPISDEEMNSLQECIESYRISDIVDRGVILELCSKEVFGESTFPNAR